VRRNRLLFGFAVAGLAVAAIVLLRGFRTDETRAPRSPPEPPRFEQPDATGQARGGLPVAAAEATPTPRYSIDGEIIDAADGTPLAQATVYAFMEGKVVAEGRSGADGAFSLDVPEKRRYELAAGAAGHVHSQIHECWTREKIEAEPGGGVRIALERALRIRGTVVDQGARPLAGATLQSCNYFYKWDMGSVAYFVAPTAAAIARTDALGRFEITELPPRGRTTFAVTLDGYGEARLRVDLAAAPVAEEYEVRLDALPVLAGRVVGEDGRPLAGAAAIPLGQVSGFVITAPASSTTDAGVFRIPWRPGFSSLLVWALGCVPSIVPVQPHELLRGSLFEVRLAKAAELRGVVRDDQGLPVAGARVRVHHYEMEAGGLRGRLYAPYLMMFKEDSAMQWHLLFRDPNGCVCIPEAVTDPEGSFHLDVAAYGDVITVLGVEREGYVDALTSWTDGSPPALARLVRAARVVITAADARTGALLPRFRVVVANPEASMVDQTNLATGEPMTAFVAPGTLRITVEAEGYQKSDVETVQLAAGAEFSRRFDLAPK
jgi:protocatechuate 3,4-dioxygenase beta subunit